MKVQISILLALTMAMCGCSLNYPETNRANPASPQVRQFREVFPTGFCYPESDNFVSCKVISVDRIVPWNDFGNQFVPMAYHPSYSPGVAWSIDTTTVFVAVLSVETIENYLNSPRLYYSFDLYYQEFCQGQMGVNLKRTIALYDSLYNSNSLLIAPNKVALAFAQEEIGTIRNIGKNQDTILVEYSFGKSNRNDTAFSTNYLTPKQFPSERYSTFYQRVLAMDSLRNIAYDLCKSQKQE